MAQLQRGSTLAMPTGAHEAYGYPGTVPLELPECHASQPGEGAPHEFDM